MNNIWRWIFGIVAGLALIGLLLYGRSERQAYRIARGAIEQRVELSQDRIDAVTEMALASVDLALKLSGELPPQEAKAEVVKQNIEEISNRLKEASEARGEAAIAKLDQSIEAYDQALQAVEDASKEAESPAVQSILDRIYGVLLATREQISQFVVNTQK
jgi:uncharacterized protein YicC (UPF0701 family)